MTPLLEDDVTLTGTLKGIPIWVRAVAILGAPTVISLYLVWLVSGMLTSDVRAMRDQLQAHALQSVQLVEKINESRSVSDAKIDTLIRIQQTQCVNAATDVIQRRNCIEAGGR